VKRVEAEGFGVEAQGYVLVADRDADKFDATDHVSLSGCEVREMR
jgi:hypothetical protein